MPADQTNKRSAVVTRRITRRFAATNNDTAAPAAAAAATTTTVAQVEAPLPAAKIKAPLTVVEAPKKSLKAKNLPVLAAVPAQAETLHDIVLRLSGLSVSEEQISPLLNTMLRHCAKTLPALERERLMPFFNLQTKTVTLADCAFSDSLTAFRLLSSGEKASASSSWIIFGELQRSPLTIKLTLKPTAGASVIDDNSLEIERLIYRRVVNPMMLCGFTPHVAAYYGELACDNFAETLVQQINAGNQDAEELYEALRESTAVVDQKLDISKMRASITERVVGKQFSDLLKRQPAKLSSVGQKEIFERAFLPVLFQVFYTLAVFGEIGLVHNDLHSGNVLVQEYSRPIENHYRINGRLYKVVSAFQARIFDFDRGAKLATAFDPTELHNTLLTRTDYCGAFGQCQSIDERRELFTLCYLLFRDNRSINTNLEKLLLKIVPIDLLTRPALSDRVNVVAGKTLAWSGRLCTCNDRRCDSCSVINDPRIKLPKEIIDLPEFDRYIVADEKDVGSAFVWTLPSQARSNVTATWKNVVVAAQK